MAMSVPSESLSLLLLEPDRATRQLYARELGKRWHVVPVERPAEALDVLATQMIHAVILELGIADTDKWQLLASVKAQMDHSPLPIIVCSSVDERGKGYELGVSAYLVKPVSPHQLSCEVARWLDGGPDDAK